VEGITTYLLTFTLNVNRLNSPNKSTIWQMGLKRKIWQSIVCKRPILLTEINTGLGWKAGRRFTKPRAHQNSRDSNTYIRQSRFQTYLSQTRQGHFILKKKTKQAIHQKEITITNLYALNVSAPNFIRHALKNLRAHIDFNTVVVGKFNNPLSPTDKSTRWKINK
jgi:hypothetical protein